MWASPVMPIRCSVKRGRVTILGVCCVRAMFLFSHTAFMSSMEQAQLHCELVAVASNVYQCRYQTTRI